MLNELRLLIFVLMCACTLICFALVGLKKRKLVVCSMDLFFGGSEAAALVFSGMQTECWCVANTSTSAVLTSSMHVCMFTYTLSFTCIFISLFADLTLAAL